MKDRKINKVFKQTLKSFAGQVMGTGERFVQEIDNCKTNEDLHELLKENAELLFNNLNGECTACDYKQMTIEEKDDEISDLEDSISDLTEDVEDKEKELQMGFVPQTLLEEYKLQAFKRAIDKFSLSEFESLLD